jgi:hypothetical protein
MMINQSLFDGGTLQTYLKSGEEKHSHPQLAPNFLMCLTVKSWMDSNPNDGTGRPFIPNDRISADSDDCAVVTLLIVNSDGFKPSDYDTVFKAVGLDTLSYAPPSATTAFGSWPSLGTLIDSGKRLVTFMDTGADFTSVPYIIDGRCY